MLDESSFWEMANSLEALAWALEAVQVPTERIRRASIDWGETAMYLTRDKDKLAADTKAKQKAYWEELKASDSFKARFDQCVCGQYAPKGQAMCGSCIKALTGLIDTAAEDAEIAKAIVGAHIRL